MRRVVVTGLGAVTPLGSGVEATWSRLLDGQSGGRPITAFKVDDLATKIACSVPRGAAADGLFNPDDYLEVKEQRKLDDFIIFGIAAAQQAWSADITTALSKYVSDKDAAAFVTALGAAAQKNR